MPHYDSACYSSLNCLIVVMSDLFRELHCKRDPHRVKRNGQSRLGKERGREEGDDEGTETQRREGERASVPKSCRVAKGFKVLGFSTAVQFHALISMY